MRIFLGLSGLALVVFLGSFLFVGESPREDSPEVVVLEESFTTPYRHGYDRGYASFLRQMGEEAPMPVAARYATGLDEHEVSEEEGRGYVDGYHRAADGFVCPRER